RRSAAALVTDGRDERTRSLPNADRHEDHGRGGSVMAVLNTDATLPAVFAESEAAARRRLGIGGYLACFKGIVWREVLRYLHQRERFLSALVRPLIWLFIFAAGFRQTLGVSIIPPYETYVLYEEFIAPGLIAMILLFNAMQSSLSMVYD